MHTELEKGLVGRGGEVVEWILFKSTVTAPSADDLTSSRPRRRTHDNIEDGSTISTGPFRFHETGGPRSKKTRYLDLPPVLGQCGAVETNGPSDGFSDTMEAATTLDCVRRPCYQVKTRADDERLFPAVQQSIPPHTSQVTPQLERDHRPEADGETWSEILNFGSGVSSWA